MFKQRLVHLAKCLLSSIGEKSSGAERVITIRIDSAKASPYPQFQQELDRLRQPLQACAHEERLLSRLSGPSLRLSLPQAFDVERERLIF